MAKIIPGILTNDEQEYSKRLKMAESVANLVQIDIIDGKFAQNLTIGVNIVKKYPTASSLEIQLMVREPDEYIADLVGIDFVKRIVFPFETENVFENIRKVKSRGPEVGLSINPQTAVSKINEFAKDLDFVCIFAANPGFSGKKLEENIYERISQSKKLFPALPVEIDIGVNMETAPKLAKAGADFLVATSALLGAPDYGAAYIELAEAARDADN